VSAGKPLRLGVFGGAFDPPHLAHVALAKAAVEQLDLHQLRVLPTGQAWHKARDLSAAEHRLAMAREAFGVVPRAFVDDRELRREGPTYTIDTLRQFKAEFPGMELVLVIGADQAEALHSWRESEQILKLATVAVAARARPDPGAPPFDPTRLRGAHFAAVELPPMPVSATQVRALVGVGQEIGHLVPPGVASYIARHHLYTKT
jgi:nicotinate-nucleotide adenylyltransferase